MDSSAEIPQGDSDIQLSEDVVKVELTRIEKSEQWTPEDAHPGLVTRVALCFMTNARLEKYSRIDCALPEHGWSFPSPINASFQLDSRHYRDLRGSWKEKQRHLVLEMQDYSFPAQSELCVSIPGVLTPASAMPAADVIVSCFERQLDSEKDAARRRPRKPVVGPIKCSIPRIVPGQMNGPKLWAPLNISPSATSEVTISFETSGCIPVRGEIVIELDSEGWIMQAHPAVNLRTKAAESHEYQLDAKWIQDQRSLQIRVLNAVVPMRSSITLRISNVTNPPHEILSESGGRITTLVASGGGVIDGPTKIQVSKISLLREKDIQIAYNAFNDARALETEAIEENMIHYSHLDRAFRNAGITLEEPLLSKLIPKTDSDDREDKLLSRDEFLRLFTNVYAPARKYGQILRDACAQGDLEQIRELLCRGCDVNTKDGPGWTPLHYAADYGQYEAITILKEWKNLEVNPQDTSGWTPLLCAAEKGHLEIVQQLFDLKADISMQNLIGRTALHWAASRNMAKVTAYLLDLGADMNEADRNGWSPLHCAEIYDATDCIQILTDRGADFGKLDILGYPPPHYKGQYPQTDA